MAHTVTKVLHTYFTITKFMRYTTPSCTADAYALLAAHLGKDYDGIFSMDTKTIRQDVKCHSKYFTNPKYK